MNTATVAVIVTGAVGLGVPTIKEVLDYLRDGRRFAEERHDRDTLELRKRLDDMAGHIMECGQAVDVLVLIFVRDGPAGDRLPPLVSDAYAKLAVARLAFARLRIYVRNDSALSSELRATFRGLKDVVDKIDVAKALGQHPQGFNHEWDVEEPHEAALQASNRFLDEARLLVGARLKSGRPADQDATSS